LCGLPDCRRLIDSQPRLIVSEDSLNNLNRSGLTFAAGILSVVFAAAPVINTAAPFPNGVQSEAKRSPILASMQAELERSFQALSQQDPKAYYIGYTVTDTQRAEVSGSNGALLNSNESRNRWLEVALRTGDYNLDNTHKIGNDREAQMGGPGVPVPIDNDTAVLRRSLWLETDKQYRSAAEWLIKVRARQGVQSDGTDGNVPDFTHEQPHVDIGPEDSFKLDRKPWEQRVRSYTANFRDSAAVINSIVTFTAQAENTYQVTTEGTQLQFGQVRYRLELFIQGKAPDGMDLDRYYNFDWVKPQDAPDDKAVFAAEAAMRKELEGLVTAPVIEPSVGPALLTGRAAAVFFHEVFGHRAEGFRQKDASEGQTFASKVGEQILPPFLSIVDDPTEERLGSADLLGYYQFDDEGVKSHRVILVDHGVLKDFEMSRSPLSNFPHSNGHGRRQIGASPLSRQGNLIVESNKTMSNAELRAKLIELIKQQNKPFGLLIDDIAGGFTFTGRGQPQAFQVLPLVVYKVFADGKPDELVRGVDIVGTPLAALTKIVATGDKTEVFNGYCGAESGSVPVSAASPAILTSELEVQKKESSKDTPPILPSPAHDVLTAGGPQ
jgi:TldD protein